MLTSVVKTLVKEIKCSLYYIGSCVFNVSKYKKCHF